MKIYKNLKFAEEDHDFDLCVYTRTHRLRLHCHMDSWIVNVQKNELKISSRHIFDF